MAKGWRPAKALPEMVQLEGEGGGTELSASSLHIRPVPAKSQSSPGPHAQPVRQGQELKKLPWALRQVATCCWLLAVPPLLVSSRGGDPGCLVGVVGSRVRVGLHEPGLGEAALIVLGCLGREPVSRTFVSFLLRLSVAVSSLIFSLPSGCQPVSVTQGRLVLVPVTGIENKALWGSWNSSHSRLPSPEALLGGHVLRSFRALGGAREPGTLEGLAGRIAVGLLFCAARGFVLPGCCEWGTLGHRYFSLKCCLYTEGGLWAPGPRQLRAGVMVLHGRKETKWNPLFCASR